MLIYNSVFDPYHCCFRAIRILSSSPLAELEVERWRILDFYLLFPTLIRDFEFPTEFKDLRKLLPDAHSRYRMLTDPKRVFFRMEPFQSSALSFLASHGVISGEDLVQRRKIKWLPNGCPESLLAASRAIEDDVILRLLLGPFMQIDLYGKSGLKARSDLFQYRYDIPRTAPN